MRIRRFVEHGEEIEPFSIGFDTVGYPGAVVRVHIFFDALKRK